MKRRCDRPDGPSGAEACFWLVCFLAMALIGYGGFLLFFMVRHAWDGFLIVIQYCYAALRLCAWYAWAWVVGRYDSVNQWIDDLFNDLFLGD